MNVLTYRFTLDTHKNGVQRILQGFQTGENVARKMEITLKEGPENYTLPLSNISASMYVKRPSDESPSINACEIDAENNRIIYSVSDQDIAEAGTVEMQLKIIDTIEETKVLVSPKFGLEVWESNIDDSEADLSPAYTALTEALAEAEAMRDSSIADLYIDENNILTIVFGDGTTYTSDVIAEAISRIDDVENYALKSEGFAVGEQNGTAVTSESPYYHNNSKYFSDQASVSAENALASKNNAYASEIAAKSSEDNAYVSETNAAASELNAATSETNALSYKNSASTSATNAATSESNALSYKNSASTSATNAATSEGNALSYKNAASTSATNAATSEGNALSYKNSAGAYATLSESYAVGGTGTRTGEDSDNAKAYKDRCEQIAASLEGGFLPMGTITFSALPDLATQTAGWMYNISDAFTSDSRFKDGGSLSYPAGSNVYVTSDKKWDVLAGALPVINGKTGTSITLDGRDLAVTGYSKASASAGIAATDTINQALGKLEKKVDDEVSLARVASFNGRTGAVTPSSSDYVGSDIKLTGYAKAQASSSIASTDTANEALGKLEYKVDEAISDVGTLNTTVSGHTSSISTNTSDIAKINEVNTFSLATSDWVSNSDPLTSTDYPYVQVKSSNKYTASSTPIWDILGANGIMTEAEEEDANLIMFADFGSSGVTLYAKDLPTNALVLRVRGR